MTPERKKQIKIAVFMFTQGTLEGLANREETYLRWALETKTDAELELVRAEFRRIAKRLRGKK